eukprot:CAMPEP_0176403174 /NCGR_PEP_ID=MMETSP0126-20121128/49873_1 /TAXON_ID=141414 ORGANISM="Strombidinopsis acuminatum, Strain SPMC142" /NCGR_SAMPLE_ID=MMETSP0126 /ASSEMBLY_ACC=CAM_ASM_000229 /LENGTH=155 /DNA_ID=CAMNT_0017781245 /DNA_START=18 /DNA_END=485 /DNA_ORIENTATION=+
MGGALTMLEHPDLAKYRTVKYKPDSTLLITGGSSGLGKEICFKYAERGCAIVIASRDKDDLIAVKEECRTRFNNDRVYDFYLDVTDEQANKEMVEFAIEKLKRIDILYLCAGISAHAMFEEYKNLEIVRKIMDVNFMGYVNATKYALPHLKAVKG